MNREGDSKGLKRFGYLLLLLAAVAGILLAARSVQDARMEVLLRAYDESPAEEKGAQARRLLASGVHAGRLVRWGIGKDRYLATVVQIVKRVPPAEVPGEVGDAAIEALRSEDETIAGAGEQILLHLGDRAVDRLQEVLAEPPDLPLAGRAVSILIRAGEKGERAVADFYIEVFRRPDRTLRKDAVEQLIQMGPAATEALIGALSDGEALVRLNAALALAYIRDPRSLQALILRLPLEEDLGVKVQIGAALQPLTGETTLGHDGEAWMAYWRQHASAFPPQILPPSER